MEKSPQKDASPIEKTLWGVGGVLAFIGGFIHVAQQGGMTRVIGARGISPIVLVIWLPGVALLAIAWLMKKARKG